MLSGFDNVWPSDGDDTFEAAITLELVVEELLETEIAEVALMIGGGVVMTSGCEEDVKNLSFSECSPAEVLWPSVGRGFSHFPSRCDKNKSKAQIGRGNFGLIRKIMTYILGSALVTTIRN